MADAAGVHLDPDVSRTRLGDFDVGYLELFIRRRDAGDLHRGHVGDITQAVDELPSTCGFRTQADRVLPE